MKKRSFKLTPGNIRRTKTGAWVFRKMINKQEIFRTLKTRAETTHADRIPPAVMKEAEDLYAMLLGGREEELKATKSRKERAATIGEIIEAFEAWPLTRSLTKKTRSGYINAFYSVIASVHLTEYADVAGSRVSGEPVRKNRPTQSKVLKRNQLIGKMSSNILTGDLVNRWIKIRMKRGPVYQGHEVLPEKDSGEMTKKELRRVLLSMRTKLVDARAIFAKNSRSTGNLMCSDTGAYKDLKLPESLDEFLNAKTPNPGKKKYKAPSRVEILDLISGLPELHRTHPEAYKAFKIAYGTGLRIDEIRKLKWSDISDIDDKYKIILEETKNGDERVNEYLGERLYLELWKMKSDPVFVIGGGLTYRKHQLGKDVSTYFRSKGWSRIQCLHELRKYFGCLLAKESKDLSVVMRALGHSDLSTTQNYYNDQIGETHNPDFAASLPAPGLEAAA